jgi:hypothetical protein
MRLVKEEWQITGNFTEVIRGKGGNCRCPGNPNVVFFRILRRSKHKTVEKRERAQFAPVMVHSFLPGPAFSRRD